MCPGNQSVGTAELSEQICGHEHGMPMPQTASTSLDLFKKNLQKVWHDCQPWCCKLRCCPEHCQALMVSTRQLEPGWAEEEECVGLFVDCPTDWVKGRFGLLNRIGLAVDHRTDSAKDRFGIFLKI